MCRQLRVTAHGLLVLVIIWRLDWEINQNLWEDLNLSIRAHCRRHWVLWMNANFREWTGTIHSVFKTLYPHLVTLVWIFSTHMRTARMAGYLLTQMRCWRRSPWRHVGVDNVDAAKSKDVKEETVGECDSEITIAPTQPELGRLVAAITAVHPSRVHVVKFCRGCSHRF